MANGYIFIRLCTTLSVRKSSTMKIFISKLWIILIFASSTNSYQSSPRLLLACSKLLLQASSLLALLPLFPMPLKVLPSMVDVWKVPITLVSSIPLKKPNTTQGSICRLYHLKYQRRYIYWRPFKYHHHYYCRHYNRYYH